MVFIVAVIPLLILDAFAVHLEFEDGEMKANDVHIRVLLAIWVVFAPVVLFLHMRFVRFICIVFSPMRVTCDAYMCGVCYRCVFRIQ